MVRDAVHPATTVASDATLRLDSSFEGRAHPPNTPTQPLPLLFLIHECACVCACFEALSRSIQQGGRASHRSIALRWGGAAQDRTTRRGGCASGPRPRRCSAQSVFISLSRVEHTAAQSASRPTSSPKTPPDRGAGRQAGRPSITSLPSSQNGEIVNPRRRPPFRT